MSRNNLIQFRRGTDQEWLGIDPVLASGEPGYNTSNNTLKIGDGNTQWQHLATNNSILSYINLSGNFNLSYDNHMVFLDTTNNSIDIHLPLASGHGGKHFILKYKTGNFPINILASGTETIDSQSNYQIFYSKNSIGIVSDNQNWYIV